MPVASHEVLPLFIEPFFRANIAGSITPSQIAYIQGLKMVRNTENLISENLYIFEEPELKSVKDAVQEVLDIYETYMDIKVDIGADFSPEALTKKLGERDGQVRSRNSGDQPDSSLPARIATSALQSARRPRDG